MTRKAVTKVAFATAALIATKCGKKVALLEEQVEINPNYSAPAYGLPSQETIMAIRMVAELEVMITDPAYEGKSVVGLIYLCKNNGFKLGNKILYVHLDDTPAINAYYKAFE